MNRAAHARGSVRRSQGLVELAFVLPILLFALFALFDFGRVIYAQYTITQDAREASRVAVAGAAATGPKYSAIRAAALAMSPAVALSSTDIRGEDGTGAACPAGVSPNDNFYPEGAGGGARAVVNIQISVPIITPFLTNLLGGAVRLCAQSVGFVQ
jgi:Flp pilus assembly protein TadG